MAFQQSENRIQSERRSLAAAVAFVAVVLVLVAAQDNAVAQQLRIVTVNAWSGLDYIGGARMGEYENPERREQRFGLLTEELRKVSADLIALQEVNPVSARGRRLATELNYDCIFQRVNSGVKVGQFGLPVNLNEGLVLLARKPLRLRFVDVFDLGSGFGFFGNTISLHWTERRIALVGSIQVGLSEIVVVAVHLSSEVPRDSLSQAVALTIADGHCRDRGEAARALRAYFEVSESRSGSVRTLVDLMRERFPGKPIILLGDFNARPDEPAMRMLIDEARFLDAAALAGIGDTPTWDPGHNENIRFSTGAVDARGDTLDVPGLLSAWYDGIPRRIDYIFLNEHWRAGDVRGADLLMDKPVDALYASDHFGLCATFDCSRFDVKQSKDQDRVPTTVEQKVEGFPIFSYDTDVGFGYGAKGFFLNFLGQRESFDLTLFNSTKGERWYRLVCSLPDFELRQGKEFDLAFDLTVDYDKYLKMNYFGQGEDSRWSEGESYTKEPLEVSGVFSRGISQEFVACLGLRYRTVYNSDYESKSLFARTASAIDLSRHNALTLYGGARYDSRDSYINPSRGQVYEIELESGGSSLYGDYSISSLSVAGQWYWTICYPKTVVAARVWGKGISGAEIPLNALCSLGGNSTLRGYPQDRFLDKAAIVLNAELRFPIIWRFAGVVGFDAGRVAHSMSAMNLSRWPANSVVGLRFLMDTFIVRADLGFGPETSGFYLNFGHIF